MAGVKKSYTFHRLLFGVSLSGNFTYIHLLVGYYSSVGEVHSVVKVGVVMLV